MMIVAVFAALMGGAAPLQAAEDEIPLAGNVLQHVFAPQRPGQVALHFRQEMSLVPFILQERSKEVANEPTTGVLKQEKRGVRCVPPRPQADPPLRIPREEEPPCALLAPPKTENQLLYDAIHYDLDIGLKPDQTLSRIEGSVRMTSVALAAGLAAVDIDAADALQITGVTDGAGNDLEWTENSDILTVALAAIPGLGDTFAIEITYRASGMTIGGGLFFSWDDATPIVYSLSQPWAARGWWPCKDQPDDKATFDLAFSVPENLTAASNGLLVETTPETRWNAPYVRWHWRESYPMSTYLASVAATIYTRIDDWFYTPEGDTMPVTHYVYPALEAAARVDLDIAASSLEFFSEIFCTYPFLAEKYGIDDPTGLLKTNDFIRVIGREQNPRFDFRGVNDNAVRAALVFAARETAQARQKPLARKTVGRLHEGRVRGESVRTRRRRSGTAGDDGRNPLVERGRDHRLFSVAGMADHADLARGDAIAILRVQQVIQAA